MVEIGAVLLCVLCFFQVRKIYANSFSATTTTSGDPENRIMTVKYYSSTNGGSENIADTVEAIKNNPAMKMLAGMNMGDMFDGMPSFRIDMTEAPASRRSFGPTISVEDDVDTWRRNTLYRPSSRPLGCVPDYLLSPVGGEILEDSQLRFLSEPALGRRELGARRSVLNPAAVLGSPVFPSSFERESMPTPPLMPASPFGRLGTFPNFPNEAANLLPANFMPFANPLNSRRRWLFPEQVILNDIQNNREPSSFIKKLLPPF